MADLDIDRIAAAALAVADARGADGFTIRAVAEALGVSPMALYHHVEDKTALVTLMADAVLAQEPLPQPTGDWREDIWQMSAWLRRITHAHPAVAQLRRRHTVWTRAQLPMTERWFSLWLQSGLDIDDAMLAGAATSMAVIGIVEEELLFMGMKLPPDEMLGSTPNARTAFRRTPQRDEEFELLVRSIVDGVHARLTSRLDAAEPRQPTDTDRTTTP